jgi:hypothetical protein
VCVCVCVCVYIPKILLDDYDLLGTMIPSKQLCTSRPHSLRLGFFASCPETLQMLLMRLCSQQMLEPPHCLHLLLLRLCSQMLDPPHGVHSLLMRLCLQIAGTAFFCRCARGCSTRRIPCTGFFGGCAGTLRAFSAQLRRLPYYRPPKPLALLPPTEGTASHTTPVTTTWTADFLTREGEGRKEMGNWLHDKSIPWNARRRLLQTKSGTFPCESRLQKWGTHSDGICCLCKRCREMGLGLLGGNPARGNCSDEELFLFPTVSSFFALFSVLASRPRIRPVLLPRTGAATVGSSSLCGSSSSSPLLRKQQERGLKRGLGHGAIATPSQPVDCQSQVQFFYTERDKYNIPFLVTECPADKCRWQEKMMSKTWNE